jgi:CubicO group peptidase (beta-lactamase class C family)
MRNKLTRASCFVLLALLPHNMLAQSELVKSDGVQSPLHRAHVGRVTFMARPIPLEQYKESDFLETFELRETGDLNIRVFLGDSLTNYLHRLAPELTADELARRGNYQFSFFLDGAPVYTENLHPGAGTAESKHTRTVFRVPLMSTTDEDSWGRFMWNRFLLHGGEEALTAGPHALRIEIRPYVKTDGLKVGGLLAAGELRLNVVRPEVDESQVAVRPVRSGSGWRVSREGFDVEKIRGLKLKVAQNIYKEVTSVVVIKNGELLVEEYFNGATRETLHDTRSVGKSFASTLTGIAIRDGHLRGETQTLREFYDLEKFANYSPAKAAVTLESLLTMSSGFEADDNDEESPGNEERMYPTADWVRFALDLRMDGAEGWRYFTGGVVVLGDILHRRVPGGLEKYADEKLFRPLGVRKYAWSYTPQGVANTAGGLRMSSLDLAKFGQLYRDGGSWKGRQLVPRGWVERSFTRRRALPGREGEFYGYLFWNKTYQVDGERLEAFYATGNGGNKVFVFKDRPLVVVITATAYNKPYAHAQVERMMERHILPAVVRLTSPSRR